MLQHGLRSYGMNICRDFCFVLQYKFHAVIRNTLHTLKIYNAYSTKCRGKSQKCVVAYWAEQGYMCPCCGRHSGCVCVCSHVHTRVQFYCHCSVKNARQYYANYSLSMPECIVLIFFLQSLNVNKTKTLIRILSFPSCNFDSHPKAEDSEGVLFLSKSAVATYLF